MWLIWLQARDHLSARALAPQRTHDIVMTPNKIQRSCLLCMQGREYRSAVAA